MAVAAGPQKLRREESWRWGMQYLQDKWGEKVLWKDAFPEWFHGIGKNVTEKSGESYRHGSGAGVNPGTCCGAGLVLGLLGVWGHH